eukprot:CAMPEP_0116013962 /NCGR_PEP_ID=MMETSP0321-20121206/6017_1 /TAXON_ID=163516 /ORGANISM="Leptocylindrus danicus var. danicus, Strain B650" /LENGTH=134 /DNA_ID=CAMNT_0003483569 /DNA_START=229 /DNA_END=630 /DNA_ORIENTATION=-
MLRTLFGKASSRLAAVTQPQQRYLSLKRLGTTDPRMSQTVIFNNTVYISGQVDTTAEDVTGQTKIVLSKVDALLEEAGTSKSNLISASIWLKDINSDFSKMNSAWEEWLDPQNKPVRATVQADMASPAILVEIQ